MAYGILVILFFFNLAVGFIIYAAIRLLLIRQRKFSDRLALLEEYILELSPTLETSQEKDSSSEDLFEAFDAVDYLQNKPNAIVDENDTEFLVVNNPPEIISTVLPIENERVQAIVSLVREGHSSDNIAKKTGYSEGEVLLVLNLLREKGPLRYDKEA